MEKYIELPGTKPMTKHTLVSVNRWLRDEIEEGSFTEDQSKIVNEALGKLAYPDDTTIKKDAIRRLVRIIQLDIFTSSKEVERFLNQHTQ